MNTVRSHSLTHRHRIASVTAHSYRISAGTWCSCFFLPCVLALCNNSFKAVDHHCGQCKRYLGWCQGPCDFVEVDMEDAGVQQAAEKLAAISEENRVNELAREREARWLQHRHQQHMDGVQRLHAMNEAARNR